MLILKSSQEASLTKISLKLSKVIWPVAYMLKQSG